MGWPSGNTVGTGVAENAASNCMGSVPVLMIW